MTKIKLCGLSRPCDIDAANQLTSDFIGFVFAKKSKRYVAPEKAKALREALNPAIKAVGVFVLTEADLCTTEPEVIAALLSDGIIDLAQLHGGEDEAYIARLRALTDRPLIQAFRIESPADLDRARGSSADYILLDNGAGGTGAAFDWSLLSGFDRPFFLAGGLGPGNVAEAITALHPFAVDVSSGIETDGHKDISKMQAFVAAARAADGKGE